MMGRSIFLSLSVLVMLAGCSLQSASPSLFLLNDSSNSLPGAADTPTNPNPPTLVVKRVEIAPYLDEGGIVYQTASHRVVIAQNNRWASPLPGQLSKSLHRTLSKVMPRTTIRGAGDDGQEDYRLITHIDRFYGRDDGQAYIAGRWSLLDADRKPVVERRFARSFPLERDGYPALVKTLARGWRRIGRDIGMQIVDQLEHNGQ